MKCALAGSFFGIPLILEEHMPKQNITRSYFSVSCALPSFCLAVFIKLFFKVRSYLAVIISQNNLQILDFTIWRSCMKT